MPTDPPAQPPIASDDLLAQIALSRDEYDRAREKLGRNPTEVELGMIAALWSEHCGYKHSRPLFHHFNRAKHVGSHNLLTELGAENAGAIGIGGGMAAVMKIESHNHPSAIEPYEGAATGVGGIVRDIIAMGAQPIALLDSLRFGPIGEAKQPPSEVERRNRRLFEGVVAGIGGYGNCLGIPVVGGEVGFGDAYSGNPLVNAMCLGIAPADSLVSATAGRPGSILMLVGADTGRDGLHGATFASVDLDTESSDRRPAVQVGNPFLEKLLMDACLGLVRKPKHRDWIEGLQDCGAAGITSATVEMAARAGAGFHLHADQVPQRERGMTPYEIMLSESQERMIVSVKPEHEQDVADWFAEHELDCTRIGVVTARDDDGEARVRVFDGSAEVAAMPVALLTDPPQYDLEGRLDPSAAECTSFKPPLPPDLEPSEAKATLLKMLAAHNITSREWIWRQFDQQVGTNTVVHAGSDAAVMRVRNPETGELLEKLGLAICVDGRGRAVELSPLKGAASAVAEAARDIACVGALPVAVTDCLNFANPEDAEVYRQLSQAIQGIADACLTLETPVVSGNVSLYNESDLGSVTPTPVIGMLGIISDYRKAVRSAFQQDGDRVILLGHHAVPASALGASEYLHFVHRLEAGPVKVDLQAEKNLVECLVDAAEAGLLQSAHDVSDGGFAVALAESAIAGPIGVNVTRPKGRLDAALFGEPPATVIVSATPENTTTLHDVAEEHGVPFTEIGVVGGDRIIIQNAPDIPLIDIPLSQAANAFENALEAAMST